MRGRRSEQPGEEKPFQATERTEESRGPLRSSFPGPSTRLPTFPQELRGCPSARARIPRPLGLLGRQRRKWAAPRRASEVAAPGGDWGVQGSSAGGRGPRRLARKLDWKARRGRAGFQRKPDGSATRDNEASVRMVRKGLAEPGIWPAAPPGPAASRGSARADCRHATPKAPARKRHPSPPGPIRLWPGTDSAPALGPPPRLREEPPPSASRQAQGSVSPRPAGKGPSCPASAPPDRTCCSTAPQPSLRDDSGKESGDVPLPRGAGARGGPSGEPGGRGQGRPPRPSGYSGGHEVKQCCPLAAVGALHATRLATFRVQGRAGGARQPGPRGSRGKAGASPSPPPSVREEPPALPWGGEGSALWPSFLLRRVALLSDPKKGNVCRRLSCRPPSPPWPPSRAPPRGRPLAAGLEEPQETRLPLWGAVRARPGVRGCLQAELRDVTWPDCSFLAKLNGFDVLLLCWKCLALGEKRINEKAN